LVAAIADLLDDPAKRAAYGVAGRARVDQLFSWRAVAQNMVVAYEGAIATYRKEHDADRRL
jgi:glycosyltransferase involved in cell wall biosynthesis